MKLRIITTAALFLLIIMSAGTGTAAGSMHKPTVLVFGLGEKCRYCVQLKQDIDQVIEKKGDGVSFKYVMVNIDRAMVYRYRILVSPTLVFLNPEGTEVYRHQGLMNTKQIIDRLESLRFYPQKG